MRTLDVKDLRTLSRELGRLFNPKSFLVPRSAEDIRLSKSASTWETSTDEK